MFLQVNEAFEKGTEVILTETMHQPEAAAGKTKTAALVAACEKARTDLLIQCVSQLVGGLLLCVIPGVIVWAGVRAGMDNNDGFGIAFLAAGILFAGFLFYRIALSIKEKYAQYATVRQSCLTDAVPEEWEKHKKERRKITLRRMACLAGVIAVVVTLIIVIPTKTERTYRKAEKALVKGYYSTAICELIKIEDENYKDSEALMNLCYAYADYEAGRPVSAYSYLKDQQFHDVTKELAESIAAFRDILEQEYEAYAAETEPATEKPKSAAEKTEPTTAVASSSNKKTGSRSSSGKDPYAPDTDGFYSPEDFYDWYYDDFFDYEEAEEYYEEHGGY